MPYDGQGVFTRVHNWEEDAANDISILASRHDAEDDNFANGFNEVLCRDGRAAMTGNLKMGANKITGLANGTTDNDAVNLSQLNSTSSTLSTAINSKANATDVVKLTENQTVAGVKTFSSSPVVPTPAVSDNSTNAASTAFIKSVLSSSGAGLATISKSGNGYCHFNNGLIIQWGKSPTGVGSSPTVTTPTSFSNASSWQVVTTAQGTGAGSNWYCQANITAANKFTINKDGDNRAVYWLAIGY